MLSRNRPTSLSAPHGAIEALLKKEPFEAAIISARYSKIWLRRLPTVIELASDSPKSHPSHRRLRCKTRRCMRLSIQLPPHKESGMNPLILPPLVILVEDEEHLAQALLFNLEAEGYRVLHFADGTEALNHLLTTTEPPALILLDVMLPGADGFTIARTLRARNLFFPILMLTARANPQDILEGLDAGADDYLPKPFDLDILFARIKTILRRATWSGTPKPSADIYTFTNREIHFDTLELIKPALVAPNRTTTHLTLMEADLLRYFTAHAGEIVSRKDILEHVWRVHEDTDTRAIDNFIVRLRRYIEDDPADPRHLLTVRGIGYRFLPTP